MSKSLENRIILVTGAAGGIGRATALVLADAGAVVIVSDIIDASDTVHAIREQGQKAEFIQADLAVETQVEALVSKSVALFGKIDGAFNNAGVEQCSIRLHELSAAQWERAIRIDLTGVFVCMKYQIKAMLNSGGGSIVNTASALGAVAIPNASEYIAAKHGVIGLTKAAAADYAADRIRVNAVLPGIINTKMVERLANDVQFAAYFDKLRDRHPIGRFGQPNEVGEAVSWLLSDASSFVTGASISVDGGYLAI